MAEKQVVTMEDGREVSFGAKQKMIKTSQVVDGVISCSMDFKTGKTLAYTVAPDMLVKFAEHGMMQKLGDEIAGVTELDDCVLAVERLIGRLDKGEWSVKRSSNGMAGTSILIRALVEYADKSVEAIKEYLSDKTQAQKLALRNNPKVKVIVERLEAEKAARSTAPVIDTDALLGELG